MQTTKENSKTPETTETKGTQVAPKRNPADMNAANEQKNTGNTNNDPTKQKPRPSTGKQEDVDLEEDEEVEDETTSSEFDSDVDQAGSEKNSPDPSRNRTGMNDPKKQ